MNCNHPRASPSSVSGARKGPKDDQPVLPSINTAFLPLAGLSGLPEVPSPHTGGATYYKRSNPDSVTAKSFNFNHEPETLPYRSCNENMDSINDDPKPFIPPISPDILKTSTKDDKDRLIKWELTGDIKITGGETYRTDDEKQPRPSDIPDASQPVHKKLRKSVSFDIPKEPSAPPLSPEPPSQPPVTGKPPVSPRRFQNQSAEHIVDAEGTNMASCNTGFSPPSSPPSTSDKPQSDQFNYGRMKRFNVEAEETSSSNAGSSSDRTSTADQFNFGRMRFKQVNTSIVSANNNIEDRVPSPPSAPKPPNHSFAIDEQYNGKVRRQWQRDSADLVIVTQNDSVSPRANAVTVQASSNQQTLMSTKDSAMEAVHRNAMQQAQMKQQLLQQEVLLQKMHKELEEKLAVRSSSSKDDAFSVQGMNSESNQDPEDVQAQIKELKQKIMKELYVQQKPKGMVLKGCSSSEDELFSVQVMNSELSRNHGSIEQKKEGNSPNDAEVDLNSNPREQYLRDLHDIFSSCDKIEEKLVEYDSQEVDRVEAEESEDLSVIKETASKIVGNVIARAISEEDRRTKSDAVHSDIFEIMDETSPEAEFFERQETPTTVPDTDEDAAAKAEILDLEISNGVNRFISSRSNSQASSQHAEVQAEELSEASQDDLDERLKLIRQDSFIEENAVSDLSAQDLEDKLKNLRNSYERKLSNSKLEVEKEVDTQSQMVSVTADQNQYPSAVLQKCEDLVQVVEKRAQMSTRSDSGIMEGSQAIKHIDEEFQRVEMRRCNEEELMSCAEREYVKGKRPNSKLEVEKEVGTQSQVVSVTAYQNLYPSADLQKCEDLVEVEEKRAQMLTRSDSGIMEGSQALNHIEQTLKLQLQRVEMRGCSEEEFMSCVEREHVDGGRQSSNSMAGSEASSVKSGPISQTLSSDQQFATNDWSCRRCFNVNFAARPSCQQCELPRQARSQDENEPNSEEVETLKSALQSYSERINALQTTVDQLTEKCASQEKKKDELCELFEERLKEMQGNAESQKLKNSELTQLYNELTHNYEISENNFERLNQLCSEETEKYKTSKNNFERMKSEHDQLTKGMRDLEETIETLNKGHSAELENLRQTLEETQNAHSSLEKSYSVLKDEHVSLSSQLGAQMQQEVTSESSKAELKELKMELEAGKAELENLKQVVASLTEEKQDSENKEQVLKEKILRKKSEINDLKEAVKKYVSEFDKLQQELSEERQLRLETEQKVAILESLKSEMEEERHLKTSNSEDIELLRRLLDEESAKCLRLGAELKNIDDRLKDYDILRENLETEKMKTERLETTIGALTDNEETIVLRKALGEAQVKIQNFEQTVELLKENNKVIDELRRELEEERSRSKSSGSHSVSPRARNEQVDDLRRDLLIEKAKRSELEQSFHSLHDSSEIHELREALETERARSGRLQTQFSVQMDELRQEGSAAALRGAGHDVATLLAAEKLKVIELEKTVDSMKADLSLARNKLRHQRVANQSSLESLEKQSGSEAHFEELEENNRRMIERIQVLEESKSELMEKVRAENNNIYQRYDTTIEDYRQQLRQIKETHTTAVTRLETEISEYQKRIEQDAAAICTLEERLNNVVKRNREYDADITSLTQQNSEMRSRLQSDIPALTTHAMTPIPRPESGRHHNRTRADKDVPQNFVAMEQLVVRLRREIANMKNQVTRAKTTNAEQQKELNAATLKITHLTGELNEVQRRRTDQRRERRKEHENEIQFTHDQLHKANSTIEQQMREMRDLKASVTKYKQAATKLKTLGKEKDSQISTLKTTVSKFADNDVRETKLQPLPDAPTLVDESVRNAHRYKEIIENQKEALLELRAKVKVLEQQAHSDRGAHSSDTSAELSTVKRELAELRAKEMLRSQVKYSPRSARKSKSADHQVTDSSHSVESCGNSYSSLVKALGETLDMKDLPDVPDDQILQITNRIRLLKDRISRKEDLLSGYENDLTKLRIAEEKVTEKDAHIIKLKNELKERIEESEYLKEALSRTRDSLECEQRMHSAAKTRKAHQLVNSTQNPTIMNGHVPHRPTSATRPRSATRPSSAKKAVSDSKESAKKKANVDRMKKKDYEIEVLKTELEYTTTDLVHAKRQIEMLSSSRKTIDQENGEVAREEVSNPEM